MTRFVQPHLVTVAGAIPAAPMSQSTQRRVGPRFEGSKSLAAVMLAGVLAASVVAADQLIETYADGHLLFTWMVLWGVAFAVVAGLAQPLRRAAAAIVAYRTRQANEREALRVQQDLWEMAHHDPRLMQDLEAAWERQQLQAE